MDRRAHHPYFGRKPADALGMVEKARCVFMIACCD